MQAKTKKILIISAIVLAMGALYWFVVRKVNYSSQDDDYSAGSGKNTIKASDMPDVEFPIQMGSYGRQVMYLQAGLNIEKNLNLALDGKVGNNTIAAINARFPYANKVVSWALFLNYYKAHKSEINEYLRDKKLL